MDIVMLKKPTAWVPIATSLVALIIVPQQAAPVPALQVMAALAALAPVWLLGLW
jgi:hypothetical protein